MAMGGYPYFNAGGGTTNGQFEGVFTYMSRVNLSSFPDGTSNTIFFGEYARCWVDYGSGDPRTGHCAGAIGGSNIFSYWEPDRGQDAPTYPQGVWYRFGSRHSGIFNVALGDGSVRSLRNNINFTTWVVMGGYKDGWVLANE
jgi:hypothetical protein